MKGLAIVQVFRNLLHRGEMKKQVGFEREALREETRVHEREREEDRREAERAAERRAELSYRIRLLEQRTRLQQRDHHEH